MTVISREEIEKNLIKDGDIDWDYIKDLKLLDKQDRTENYGEAMFVLKDKGLITTTPDRNYFIIGEPAGGFSLEPKISVYHMYFREERHARRFRDTFHPEGLIARVVS